MQKVNTKRGIREVIKELIGNFEYLSFNTIVNYCRINGLYSEAEKYLVYACVKHKIKY